MSAHTTMASYLASLPTHRPSLWTPRAPSSATLSDNAEATTKSPSVDTVTQRGINGQSCSSESPPDATTKSRTTTIFRPWLTEPKLEAKEEDEEEEEEVMGQSTVGEEEPHSRFYAMEAMATNMGKSPLGHRCIYCGKIYSRKYGLKIHLRTHTGFKPLKCKVCQRAFGDPSNLNKHHRLHETNTEATNSVAHATLQHSTPHSHAGRTPRLSPFKCHLCTKTTYGQRNFHEHMVKVHSQLFKPRPLPPPAMPTSIFPSAAQLYIMQQQRHAAAVMIGRLTGGGTTVGKAGSMLIG